MDEDYIKSQLVFWKWEAQQTAEVRKQFRNDTFLTNSELMKDLFDETPIPEQPCQRKYPRIGSAYQVQIPNLTLTG